MQTMVERGCGLDVHQATVVACLLIVLKNGKVQKQIRTFGTTTRELVSLREWRLQALEEIPELELALEGKVEAQHWTASFWGVLGGFVTDLCNRLCNSQEVVQQFWTLVSQPSILGRQVAARQRSPPKLFS
jgi:hypothetical protein